MSSPEEIQQDIERTRERLSGDVDRLSEKVSPGKVVGRQVDAMQPATHPTHCVDRQGEIRLP